jgi:hypothetical protein
MRIGAGNSGEKEVELASQEKKLKDWMNGRI